MSPDLKYAAEIIDAAGRYATSLAGGMVNAKTFAGVEGYCMFIGYPRSGHSVVGSLLDAHPNMIVANELDALKYVYARFSRRQIYYLLLRNSQQHARAGKKLGDYAYAVPNQWQGKFDSQSGLKIIGDKKGGSSTLRLARHPGLLDRIIRLMRVGVKFIHVVRNPYDNITTIATRGRRSLQEATDYYFSMCSTVLAVADRVPPDACLELRHEDFIADPRSSLSTICRFLGMEASDGYLTDCVSIVRPNPNQSRRKVRWDGNAIDAVARRIRDVPYLEGYGYDE